MVKPTELYKKVTRLSDPSRSIVFMAASRVVCDLKTEVQIRRQLVSSHHQDLQLPSQSKSDIHKEGECV